MGATQRPFGPQAADGPIMHAGLLQSHAELLCFWFVLVVCWMTLDIVSNVILRTVCSSSAWHSKTVDKDPYRSG